MTKVAFYGRRSRDKQDKTSTDQQLRSCRDFAKTNKLKIVAKYLDEACSRSDDDWPLMTQSGCSPNIVEGPLILTTEF